MSMELCNCYCISEILQKFNWQLYNWVEIFRFFFYGLKSSLLQNVFIYSIATKPRQNENIANLRNIRYWSNLYIWKDLLKVQEC